MVICGKRRVYPGDQGWQLLHPGVSHSIAALIPHMSIRQISLKNAKRRREVSLRAITDYSETQGAAGTQAEGPFLADFPAERPYHIEI